MAKKKGAGDKPQSFDESNGQYTKESKRAEAERIYDTVGGLNAYRQNTLDKEIVPSIEKEAITLPDETLPRSVGAKWANYDIQMPDGTVAHFQEGSKITHKEVFAGAKTKTPIRDIERLIEEYPGTKRELWQKIKGRADIIWKGEPLKAEIHWYEEPNVGKKEIKFKKEL